MRVQGCEVDGTVRVNAELMLSQWHWPTAKRTETGAKMHAKLAVADHSVLFVTSANLTQSGVGKNIEAGLLIRGGAALARAVEHVDALRARVT